MSYFFRGSRADIESGLPGFMPDRRPVRMHAGGRPVNNNSMAFLVTVLVLFMILNSHQMSPNFLLWLVLGVFLMATSLRMYATCQQLQAQAQAHAAAASGFLGGTELRLHVPPSIAFATRGRLQSLRLQLALLDREFDDLDYDALRALDSDNPPDAPSMTEEEINSLPVHKYKLQSSSRQRQDPILYLYIVVDQCCNMHRLLQYLQLRIFRGLALQLNNMNYELNMEYLQSLKRQEGTKLDGNLKTPEDELTCSVCLEQVSVGELVRSLPCLHQFHANCIDPWLRQQGTCPVCKHRVNSGWHAHSDGEVDMV
ncbi:E3 ubiquitin-protein ligase [Musa troglodytarum]|uniref:RING-type E3 ubiquitin transferase n=1 Tax=Musa troglodytarum TaxID=320322 RepID=A0A9E7HV54_9LILI|nr:E3 ubiquitin-protein ligase [Musa troglodytarum]